MYVPRPESKFTEYDPDEEEPRLFLAIAELGEEVWKVFDGMRLGFFLPFFNVEAPVRLQQLAVAFIERYGCPTFRPDYCLGPPVDWSYGPMALFFESLHTMLR